MLALVPRVFVEGGWEEEEEDADIVVAVDDAEDDDDDDVIVPRRRLEATRLNRLAIDDVDVEEVVTAPAETVERTLAAEEETIGTATAGGGFEDGFAVLVETGAGASCWCCCCCC